ncbi:hypothetical protein SDC9_198829 [bioreactor metagenome]|uniref:Uncharacterized protein n=1 Tax=bioreactor metagenome TaxID=1076179 RepID=A0A645IIS0_9ZZZZ
MYAIGDAHQVARVEVAMDKDPGFGEIDRNDLVEGGHQRGFVLGVQAHALVAADVPLGEEHQFPAQQGFGIVG